jgi:hypothetical protein
MSESRYVTATERPIIFSGGMVRAILAGRKTMTRRMLKPQPEPFARPDGSLAEVAAIQLEGEPCPRIALGRVLTRQKVRFAVGDRLWVREAFAVHRCAENRIYARGDMHPWGSPIYRATFSGGLSPECEGFTKWRPSIHMPRWASRITLAVTAVKIERLHEITVAEAISEGALESGLPYVGAMTSDMARVAFSLLWDSLHGKRSWEEDPWVVAVSFSRTDG